MQIPQSPLFNVNDLFYFRKLSTEISAEQSICFGTRVMKCDEILKIVDKVWKSTDDTVTISRGWMSHYQVVAAAFEMNGDNAYLTEKNGLDFGVRVNFYPNQDKTGVVRVLEIENETIPAHQIANERIRKGLRYKVPSILNLKKGTLSDEQFGFLVENLDNEKMDDEICEFWDHLISEM